MTAPLRPGAPRIPFRIAGTATVPAGELHSTVDLVARLPTPTDAGVVISKTGIESRHFAGENTAAALGARALGAALAEAAIAPEDVERLIFVSSVGGDAIVPATSNLVAAELGIRGTCDCFDLNNGCMGFLSAFDVAAHTVALGGKPVAVVVGELLSRYIMPEDPRAYLVLADGVAAVVLTPSDTGEGILARWLRNDGGAPAGVAMPHPGLTGKRETIRFAESSNEITRRAIDGFRECVDTVLGLADVALADVDWVLLHQPNGSLFRLVVQQLGIDPARTLRIVDEVGSVGAASIPISLDRLRKSGRVRRGDRILMVGVGAGVSFGGVLVQVA